MQLLLNFQDKIDVIEINKSKPEIIKAFCDLMEQFDECFSCGKLKKDNKKDIDKIIDQIGQVRRIAWQMGIDSDELELAKFIRKKEMGVKGMDSIINDCRRKLNGKTNS
jgi:hypothetical protein